MNEEIKKEWIKRLRSGNYRQGRGRLRTENNEYCCLGILCEIAEEQGVCFLTSEYGWYYYDGLNNVLPVSVQNWAGLCAESPFFSNESSLAGLNDSGWTFEQIADMIQNNEEIINPFWDDLRNFKWNENEKNN